MVSKYKRNIKFETNWGTKMEDPLKWGCQKSNFLAIHARHMKVLGLANTKKK